MPEQVLSFFSASGVNGPTSDVDRQATTGLVAKLLPSPRKRRATAEVESRPKKATCRASKRTGNSLTKCLKWREQACCKKRCTEKVRGHSVEALATNFEAQPFRARETQLLQDLQRSRIVAVEPETGLRQTRWEYKVDGVAVCQTAFAWAHAMGPRQLQRKKKLLVGDGVSEPVLPATGCHGRTGTLAPSEARQECAEWMRHVFGLLAQPFPNKAVRDRTTGEERPREFLTPGIFATQGEVYDHYKSVELGEGRTPVAYTTFLRVWRERHDQVSSAAYLVV